MPVPTTYEFQQQVRQMQANVDLILTKAPVLFGLIGVGDAFVFASSSSFSKARISFALGFVPGFAPPAASAPTTFLNIQGLLSFSALTASSTP